MQSKIDSLMEHALLKPYPMELFMTEELNPMEFAISPGVNEFEKKYLKNLENLIKNGGGNIRFNRDCGGTHTIILMKENEKIFDSKNELFKCSYIVDCVMSGSVLDIKAYRVGKTKYEDYDPNEVLYGNVSWTDIKRKERDKVSDLSEFEDDDDYEGHASNKTNYEGQASDKTNVRKAYYLSDDKKILDHIISNKLYGIVKGNYIWKAMESRKILKERTWQSLKDRYLKQIVPNLKRYKITADQQDAILIGMKEKPPPTISKNNNDEKIAESEASDVEVFSPSEMENESRNKFFVTRNIYPELDFSRKTPLKGSPNKQSVQSPAKNKSPSIEKNKKIQQTNKILEKACQESNENAEEEKNKDHTENGTESSLLDAINDVTFSVHHEKSRNKSRKKQVVTELPESTFSRNDKNRSIHYEETTNSSDSNSDNDTPPPAVARRSKPIGRRHKYTKEDDLAIVKHIEKKKCYDALSGRKIWQIMESKNVLPGRTWQSMKDRFFKQILSSKTYFFNQQISDKCKMKLDAMRSRKPEKRGKQQKYTKTEDTKIINLFLNNSNVSSKLKLYNLIASKLSNRTWEGVKERLVKIRKNLSYYDITAEKERKFKKLFGDEIAESHSSLSDEEKARKREKRTRGLDSGDIEEPVPSTSGANHSKRQKKSISSNSDSENSSLESDKTSSSPKRTIKSSLCLPQIKNSNRKYSIENYVIKGSTKKSSNKSKSAQTSHQIVSTDVLEISSPNKNDSSLCQLRLSHSLSKSDIENSAYNETFIISSKNITPEKDSELSPQMLNKTHTPIKNFNLMERSPQHKISTRSSDRKSPEKHDSNSLIGKNYQQKQIITRSSTIKSSIEQLSTNSSTEKSPQRRISTLSSTDKSPEKQKSTSLSIEKSSQKQYNSSHRSSPRSGIKNNTEKDNTASTPSRLVNSSRKLSFDSSPRIKNKLEKSSENSKNPSSEFTKQQTIDDGGDCTSKSNFKHDDKNIQPRSNLRCRPVGKPNP